MKSPQHGREVSAAVAARQLIEKRIAEAVIRGAFEAGYKVEVNNGEEDVLSPSSDIEVILKAMFSTDEDVLYMYKQGKTPIGWVKFVYGNNGWDVVSDYTVNLESIMDAADKLAATYSG